MEVIRKTNQYDVTTLRRELEETVCAWNTILKDAVKTMDNIILLRNCHPSLRADMAYQLKDAGMITKDELTEFTKPVKPVIPYHK